MAPNLKRSGLVVARERKMLEESGKNVKTTGEEGMSHLIARPGVGKVGKSISLSNHLSVSFDASRAIYHYDISIESSMENERGQRGQGKGEKRVRKLSYAVNREVMGEFVANNLSGLFGGCEPVYDGQKNLYTMRRVSGLSGEGTTKKMLVRMEREGSASYGQYMLVMKCTGMVVSLNEMQLYFDNLASTFPMSAIAALDIVMREGPTLSKIPIGSSLFLKEQDDAFRINIGGNKQLAFGFYQSLRPTSSGLHLVVDRSCCSFYGECGVIEMIGRMFAFTKDGLVRRARWTDAERKRIEKELKGVSIVITKDRRVQEFKLNNSCLIY
jgi:eukaryotic translation initiation factor 2C